jgi:hypothetical protein
MSIESIEAGDLRPGDFVYNPHGYCPSAKWVRVTAVRRRPTTYTTEGGHQVPGESVVIDTTIFTTVKHPREGLAVNRGRAEIDSVDGFDPEAWASELKAVYHIVAAALDAKGVTH